MKTKLYTGLLDIFLFLDYAYMPYENDTRLYLHVSDVFPKDYIYLQLASTFRKLRR